MANKTVSFVRELGGVPALFVNGEPFPACAYMTYLEKFNAYDDFSKAGYNLFSVPVLFSGRWISATSGFKPFNTGIFDVKDNPDFSAFDESVKKILSVCPDAYIFPRVNISMPRWWEEENPDSLNVLPDGSSLYESLLSGKFLETAKHFLREFIAYVNGSPYASHIVGYQLAGGNTEEWFHFDLHGGCCENALPAFYEFLQENYPELKPHGLPDLSLLDGEKPYHGDEYLAAYLDFASSAVAGDICALASVAKEACEKRLVVGTFYGYSLEVTSPLWGTHALKKILSDKNIDFICSPNSYLGIRDFACDHSEMYPADSVRLHGKLCFQECDIRTHLTVLLKDKDPETDPLGNLSHPIWLGPETGDGAISALRKSFARQLIKGNGFWWFDMWGGWYADDDIMSEMGEYRKIYAESLSGGNRKVPSELAVFTDESSYKLMTNCALRNAVYDIRKNLGLCAVPYDTYDVFDFSGVFKNYKAVIFLSAAASPGMKSAVNICKENNIPYIAPAPGKYEFAVSELSDFLSLCKIKTYAAPGDIVYAGPSFVSVSALSDGDKTVFLDGEYEITELLCDKNTVVSDCISVSMKKGETKIFKIKKNGV